MLKSKRWPWLTDGWEVVEDVARDAVLEYLTSCVRQPVYFDLSYVRRPADRIGMQKRDEC